MANVKDVAAYILHCEGEELDEYTVGFLTDYVSKKYREWEGVDLFNEEIMLMVEYHLGTRKVAKILWGNIDRLDQLEVESINTALAAYHRENA